MQLYRSANEPGFHTGSRGAWNFSLPNKSHPTPLQNHRVYMYMYNIFVLASSSLEFWVPMLATPMPTILYSNLYFIVFHI